MNGLGGLDTSVAGWTPCASRAPSGGFGNHIDQPGDHVYAAAKGGASEPREAAA